SFRDARYGIAGKARSCRISRPHETARTLLDPTHLGRGVVTVDAHEPAVEQSGLDRDLRIGPAHAGQRGGLDLLPDLAVFQGVFPAIGEALELADDAACDRLGGAEIEEAA